MSWNTIYITGKSGFKEEILKSLENSDLPFMPGSTGNEQDISLFWIDDSLSLRDFKKAIGSKVVFKYRLQFFNHLEELQGEQEKKPSLTPREEAMIREMNEWQNTQNYLHSA
jgi:hypothetical protein